VSDDFAENNLIYTLYAVFYFILSFLRCSARNSDCRCLAPHHFIIHPFHTNLENQSQKIVDKSLKLEPTAVKHNTLLAVLVCLLFRYLPLITENYTSCGRGEEAALKAVCQCGTLYQTTLQNKRKDSVITSTDMIDRFPNFSPVHFALVKQLFRGFRRFSAIGRNLFAFNIHVLKYIW